MSAAEILALSARLMRLERSDARLRIDAAIAMWGLEADMNRPIRRRGPAHAERVAMAAALIGDQEVVLLDEPMRSVAPDERTRLLRLSGLRRTVLLASRYPASEVGVVGEVALIRDGKIAVHAPVSALAARGLALTHRGLAALAEEAIRRQELPAREDPRRASA
jgi:ABC-2 type transport system ATP-binding protein